MEGRDGRRFVAISWMLLHLLLLLLLLPPLLQLLLLLQAVQWCVRSGSVSCCCCCRSLVECSKVTVLLMLLLACPGKQARGNKDGPCVHLSHLHPSCPGMPVPMPLPGVMVVREGRGRVKACTRRAWLPGVEEGVGQRCLCVSSERGGEVRGGQGGVDTAGRADNRLDSRQAGRLLTIPCHTQLVTVTSGVTRVCDCRRR